MERLDKRHVQHDVKHGADKQKHQRRKAVADCTQYGNKQIVQKLRKHTDENDKTVGICSVVHFGVGGRKVDPSQHKRQN